MFCTDFIQNNGTFMILTEEKGIHSDRLSRIQCNMLSSARIPNVLNVSVKELDFQVSLHYEITGKRMLAHVIKSEKIAPAEFYGLLLQVVTVLADSKKYMLKASNFLLEDTFVFVDGSLSSGTIYLTYVPLIDVAPNAGPKTFLAFAMALIPCVVGLEGEGIQQIAKLCASDELFTYTEMKVLLLRLLEGQSDRSVLLRESAYRSDIPSVSTDGTIHAHMSPDNHVKPVAASFSFQEQGSDGEEGARQVHKSTMESGGNELSEVKEREDVPAAASRKRTYSILGALLLSAIGWKFLYLDHTGSGGLYAALGVTGAAAVGAVLLLKGAIPLGGFGAGDRSEAFEMQAQHQMAAGMDWNDEWSQNQKSQVDPAFGSGSNRKEAGWRWNQSLWEEDIETPSPASDVPVIPSQNAAGARGSRVIEYLSETNIEHVPKAEMAASERYVEPPGRTELLSAPRQATVLLGGNSKTMPAEPQKPQLGFLERREKGSDSIQKIELRAGSFVIGRSSDVVQYVENSTGTSRAHIELMVEHKQWRIKDLGSKNGTVLNGEDMVPYKDYALSPGDEFKIASASYRLCSD
nr:DUF6382 domain-containing protein [Paenibacillus caui]